MRLFLAVFPTPEVQRAAYAASESLRRPGDGVSWVKPDNLHFTLRFLGELDESWAARAALALEQAAAPQPAFTATLGAPGAFPKPAKARVLWLGLAAGAPQLEALARELEAALRAQGFPAADRRFTAHLTLGRVRTGEGDWDERLAQVRAEPLGFTVERVQLIESRLSPGGSIYTPKAEGRLRE